MPWMIAATVAIGYASKRVADAADTTGNAALKLGSAVLLIAGGYYVVRRIR